jgi:hypothetical protein
MSATREQLIEIIGAVLDYDTPAGDLVDELAAHPELLRAFAREQSGTATIAGRSYAVQPHVPTDPTVLAEHAAAVQALTIYWWGRDTEADATVMARQSVQVLATNHLLAVGRKSS